MTTRKLTWPPLYRGILIRRYQRFLADIRLDTGEMVTAHCPNSGKMTGCAEPGRPVFLSFQSDPRRKLRYTWEMIDMPSSLVGINTQIPNRLISRTIAADLIPEFEGYDDIRREVAVGNHSRIDLQLTGKRGGTCLMEIKSCTLVQNGLARFPDAVTIRGQKHLAELTRISGTGTRCVMFYLVQRMDAVSFSPADDIDPAYGEKLRRAVKSGVEMIAYDVDIDRNGIGLRRKLPCRL